MKTLKTMKNANASANQKEAANENANANKPIARLMRRFPGAMREFTIVQTAQDRVFVQIDGYAGHFAGHMNAAEIALLQVLQQRIFDRAFLAGAAEANANDTQ